MLSHKQPYAFSFRFSDVLQERFVQIKRKRLLSAAQHSLVSAQSLKHQVLSPSFLCFTLHKEMPNKSQRKHSGPSGLSLCLITEALHRWTTASTGKTPTILKLDSWVCYQVRGKTNRGAFIFFMQKFCKLLICNVTFYSKCLNFFPKWSH